MMKFIANFRKDEDGAVTVDWVVLTAAVVGLAIAAYASIQSGSATLTSNTSDYLTTIDVGNVVPAAEGGEGGEGEGG